MLTSLRRRAADLQGSYKVQERILAVYSRLDFTTKLLGRIGYGQCRRARRLDPD